MDIWTYLTSPIAAFGGLEWGLLVVEGVIALGGLYLGFLRADAHPVRGALLRRLGLAMLILGVVGLVLGVLGLAAISPFTLPIWVDAVVLVEVVMAIFAIYYWLARYPAQMAAYEQKSRSASRSSRPRPQQATLPSTNGVAVADSRPTAGSGRRESRRDRKRRSR